MNINIKKAAQSAKSAIKSIPITRKQRADKMLREYTDCWKKCGGCNSNLPYPDVIKIYLAEKQNSTCFKKILSGTQNVFKKITNIFKK